MQRDYFEKLIGGKVTATECDKIQVINNYHPSKLNMEKIAEICKISGMNVIHDMYCREMDIEMKNLEATIKEAQEEMAELEVVISKSKERLKHLEWARNS